MNKANAVKKPGTDPGHPHDGLENGKSRIAIPQYMWACAQPCLYERSPRAGEHAGEPGRETTGGQKEQRKAGKRCELSQANLEQIQIYGTRFFRYAILYRKKTGHALEI